nr:LLM class flavin-dependent oxidoreductase [Streptomyces clavuligerus]
MGLTRSAGFRTAAAPPPPPPVPSFSSFSPFSSFSSCERLARTAERGLFDFLLLTGDRAHRDGPATGPGAGCRPEPLTVLGALAAVTDRLGLAAGVDPLHDEPYAPARRLASLDHLSGGRAACHLETAPDNAGHGVRVAEFLRTARELWDSWSPCGQQRSVVHRGRHFTVEGEFTVPRSPQGHPVVIQEDGRTEGRDLAARTADVLVVRQHSARAARGVAADITARLAAHGRAPGDLRVMPEVTVVLGDTAAEARERAGELDRLRVPPGHALRALGRIWGRDLSGYDPDGPLPGLDPDPGPPGPGRAPADERLRTAARWRALAADGGLSIRRTVARATAPPPLAGTPQDVAGRMDTLVREGVADGFVLVPHPAAGGLDDFVDRVVPLLQERGVFRTAYEGPTLRSHLGLAAPVWKG